MTGAVAKRNFDIFEPEKYTLLSNTRKWERKPQPWYIWTREVYISKKC